MRLAVVVLLLALSPSPASAHTIVRIPPQPVRASGSAPDYTLEFSPDLLDGTPSLASGPPSLPIVGTALAGTIFLFRRKWQLDSAATRCEVLPMRIIVLGLLTFLAALPAHADVRQASTADTLSDSNSAINAPLLVDLPPDPASAPADRSLPPDTAYALEFSPGLQTTSPSPETASLSLAGAAFLAAFGIFGRRKFLLA